MYRRNFRYLFFLRTVLQKNFVSEKIYLSSHNASSWCSKEFRGNSFAQYWHSAGNSDTAFSTARLRDAVVLLISILQLGHVAISSRSLASARTWVKQPAHIKCPLAHCEHHCSMYIINVLATYRSWCIEKKKKKKMALIILIVFSSLCIFEANICVLLKTHNWLYIHKI